MSRITVCRGGNQTAAGTLWNALTAVCPRIARIDKPVIAFTGSGGKTTYIYTLARELRRLGRRPVIMTTTHMYEPAQGYSTGADDAERALRQYGAAVAAISDGGGKIGYIGDEAFWRCLSFSGLVLVEADGSRRKALKVFGPHEPVLPPKTDCIVHIAGASAVGQPAGESCFRWERAGLEKGQIITEALFLHIAAGCVRHLRRRYGVPVVLAVNQQDGLAGPVSCAALHRMGETAVLTHFGEDERTDALCI